ncbi:MAG TPA: glycosyl hydrolase 115 family protein [Bacillota bacterium]|nr:glycosyl hydrolase 115 family protein [Bacillota bacterium]
MNEKFVFHVGTRVILPDPLTSPVRHAWEMLRRDMEKVLEQTSEAVEIPSEIFVTYTEPGDPIHGLPERFMIRFVTGQGESLPRMEVVGSDDLGLVYGLLHLSEVYLGVDPFWFWADREPWPRNSVTIPAVTYISPVPRVRYRGWFVNDEVCLIGWNDQYPPPREVWQPVFEALLRCGGNIVIPGTDLPRNGIHYQLACEMGLWITHHHAEPLGAEMFLRAHPDKEPIYHQYAPLFEELWREAVQRNSRQRTVWVLGFRGQGDLPFWENDLSCTTPKQRGALIGQIIRKQYEIVRQYVASPVCAIYLYGEITELYRDGLLHLPDGVIKIWADNGYGKMVSRRHGNYNPRVPALPDPEESGPHGVYYHVTFHDLQASSHLTLAANPPELIIQELGAALQSGADEYLLVNSGNIRPHLYTLDLARCLWRDGRADMTVHDREFGMRYFPAAVQRVMECYQQYFQCTIAYGPNRDDRAGDEFYHHPLRAMISHWMQGNHRQTLESLHWATGKISFRGQINWFHRKCTQALAGWEKLYRDCRGVRDSIPPEEARFLTDNLLLPVMIHDSGCRGIQIFCRSFLAWDRGDLPEAFVLVSQAITEYSAVIRAMEDAEHDKWHNFYRADWLTNVKCTVYALDALRRYLRVLGDGPHYFSWYKQYVIPETERRIYLENTQRRTLSDDELAERLKAVLNCDDRAGKG